MIAVPQIGEEEDGHVNHVPKSLLVSIIAPRHRGDVRDWCATGWKPAAPTSSPGRRVVLTGGACQLHGVRELAGLILDKQVRIGRPLRRQGTGRVDARTGLFDRCGLAVISRCPSAPKRPRPQRVRAARDFSVRCRTGSANIFKYCLGRNFFWRLAPR
jgi:cell division protein FtsA